jgi:hypothetical protein
VRTICKKHLRHGLGTKLVALFAAQLVYAAQAEGSEASPAMMNISEKL